MGGMKCRLSKAECTTLSLVSWFTPISRFHVTVLGHQHQTDGGAYVVHSNSPHGNIRVFRSGTRKGICKPLYFLYDPVFQLIRLTHASKP